MKKFVDLHCDTLTKAFDTNQNLFENNLQIDLKRLKNFGYVTQVFAIWISKKNCLNPFEYTKNVIGFFDEQIKLYFDTFNKAKTLNDIIKNEQNKKISAMLAIEGGESLQNNMENLFYFYEKGIKILTLTWNVENDLGYGALTDCSLGLKRFGKDVVRQMQGLNMILDVSHLNEAGFWDVYKLTKKPFIASHSNCYKICNNKRNLKDEQIKAIAQKGGVIGINFYPKFISCENNADISFILKHIEHIEKLVGFNHISIGGDLDGIDKTLKDFKDISAYESLFDILTKNYGSEICSKIMYQNFLDMLKNFD